ncbi:hypothetical protein PsAD37_01740 [Pseudovibrio sp. Ad37]|nr:hypothetical protein PsWM33_03716 [Pseudovibrio sp. WM33]KZL26798.1 hypothetical protein PsAD37_01740 [Pseudovibrio sp. Ad37]
MTDTKLSSARRNKEKWCCFVGLEGFGWDGEYPGGSKAPSGLNDVW